MTTVTTDLTARARELLSAMGAELPEGSDLTSTTRFYGCVAAARTGAEKSVATAQAMPVDYASR